MTTQEFSELKARADAAVKARIDEIKSLISVGDEFIIPLTGRHGRRCGTITKINRTMFEYEMRFESGRIITDKEYIDTLYGTGSRIAHDGRIVHLP